MNSSANREGLSVFVRVAALVLSLALIFAFGVGKVSAREELPNPYIQPGDGDGPAGISESVSQKEAGEDDMIPTLLANDIEETRGADVFVFTVKRLISLQFVMSMKKGN